KRSTTAGGQTNADPPSLTVGPRPRLIFTFSRLCCADGMATTRDSYCDDNAHTSLAQRYRQRGFVRPDCLGLKPAVRCHEDHQFRSRVVLDDFDVRIALAIQPIG